VLSGKKLALIPEGTLREERRKHYSKQSRKEPESSACARCTDA